jgi:small-conductance mechanosensitive channel
MHPTPVNASLSGTAQSLDVFQFFTPGRILSVALVLFSAWLLIRYAARILDTIAVRGPRARFVVKWIEPILRITLWLTAVLLSFDLLAPSRETFLAAVGSVAIAVGLGAQDLVKNLVGGLVILVDRPYQLGDRVRIGDAYGEVDHIGLRSTKLTTPDDTRVTIPNANLLGGMAFNANSGVPDCQVVTDLFLPVAANPGEALRIGYEAACTSPYVHLKKPVVVLLGDEFQQRPYLRLRVKAYVYDHRFEPQMQSDITARAKAEFLRRGMFAGWK